MTGHLDLSITVTSEEETRNLAKDLSQLLKVGDIVRLDGTLGAGKTAFARALIQSLAEQDLEVPSPTFNLLLLYDTPAGMVYHYDFYRLEDPEEIWELDIDDAYDSGITIMEWAERLEDLAPQNALRIELVITGDLESSRVLQITGDESWGRRLAGFSQGKTVND
ncbi:tRNA (adenosine(37)-N6)-threonylcarbamoyltransferase complex ATPase subunit type 1 TsaE [Sneathiella glossodoripedis]|uniref:tRNA (adenosine(37)-N6)-threonylcarbamoyltransferase complex ATPase subunit type 1 TsaE n=1 Tax=Sneathiella glossodoripedis TaxID=418853 RepID=UPI00046EF561|nr:tRNA (adenosine(37)-N6)-threonylcarbamoyltransferase complex ATPase subunit type 1 TsaE [Sneathiella glossodoripedis]